MKTIGEEKADPNTAVPEKSIRIVDCGVNKVEKKYDLSLDQVDSEEDISQDWINQFQILFILSTCFITDFQKM